MPESVGSDDMRSICLFTLCFISTWLNAQQTTLKSPDYPDHVDLSYYLDHQGIRTPIDSKDDWLTRRQHVLAGMQKVMGAFPEPDSPVELKMQVHEEVRTARVTRQLISYHTDSDTRRVQAYLFLPTQTKKTIPAVLCLHQTIGIGKKEPVSYTHLTLPTNREV